MSAKMALGFISSLRKTYPALTEELDRDKAYFENKLVEHNNLDHSKMGVKSVPAPRPIHP